MLEIIDSSFKLLYYHLNKADVAKWLRHWVVIPIFAGSIPVVRPKKKLENLLELLFKQ